MYKIFFTKSHLFCHTKASYIETQLTVDVIIHKICCHGYGHGHAPPHEKDPFEKGADKGSETPRYLTYACILTRFFTDPSTSIYYSNMFFHMNFYVNFNVTF